MNDTANPLKDIRARQRQRAYRKVGQAVAEFVTIVIFLIVVLGIAIVI